METATKEQVLPDILQRLLTNTGQLIEAIKKEHSAISQSDENTLNQVTIEKNTQLKQIIKQQDALFTCIQYNHKSPLSAAVKSYIKQHYAANASQLMALWENIEIQIKLARTQNEISAGAIQINQDLVRRKLDILLQNKSDANTYDQTGKMS